MSDTGCEPPSEPTQKKAFEGFRPSALNGLFVLALFYTLYILSDLVLPILLALVFSLLLNPIVSGMEKIRIPRPLGSGLLVAALIFGTGYAVSGLVDPATQWMKKAPEMFTEVRSKLGTLLKTLRQVDKATEQVVEQLSAPGAEPPQPVQLQQGGLNGFLLGQTRTFLAGMAMMFFLLFFFLESGDHFLRKLVKVLPNWSYKRMAVEAARETQAEISKYLLTITMINTVLGAVVAGAMHLLGMPNPALWGVLAGLLNYLPYIGPAVTFVIISAVALLTFEDAQSALLAPLVYLVITSVEGQIVTPHIVGGRLALNPVVVFVGIIFFAWLWGFLGALIAVPILATLKIVFERAEEHSAIAELLGR